MSGSCRDLREFQESGEVVDAFSRLVSGGRPGYKTIIDKGKKIQKCSGCSKVLLNDEKFCPECGTKVEKN